MSNAFFCKITSFLVALTLVVVPFCSFADDESAADPVQGSAPLSFTLDEWEFISQASDDDDRQLRQAAVLTATATTYDLDDIYSILSSVRMIDNSRYVWATYDESVWSEVHNVYNKLITNSYNNTWYSVSELVALLLSQFSSFSSNFYSPISGSASLWQLIDDIKTFVGLGLFDSQANSYLDLINSKIGTLNSSMTSGFNAVFSSINSTTSAVNSTTNAVNNTTNAVNNVVSSVDSFKSDFNNISWLGTSSGQLLDSSFSPVSSNVSVTSSSYDYYYKLPVGTYTVQRTLYHLTLSCFPGGSLRTDDYTFEFYNSSSQILRPVSTDFIYTSFNSNRQLEIYLFNCYLDYPYIFVRIIPNNSSSSLILAPSCSISYLNSDSNDFFTVYNFLIDTVHYDTWKKLYASDDLIQAKQNQRGFEDSVLDDFTGNGSASASVADAVDVKGVQGQVLGALGSSASASDLTTILNTSNPGSDNSFFSFFTQRVYNDLNNVQTTRGVVPEDVVYINFLDQRNDEYINLLGGSW